MSGMSLKSSSTRVYFPSQTLLLLWILFCYYYYCYYYWPKPKRGGTKVEAMDAVRVLQITMMIMMMMIMRRSRNNVFLRGEECAPFPWREEAGGMGRGWTKPSPAWSKPCWLSCRPETMHGQKAGTTTDAGRSRASLTPSKFHRPSPRPSPKQPSSSPLWVGPL